MLIYGLRSQNISSKKEAYQDYLAIAWPVALEAFLMNLISSVDLAMAGHLGSQAQAAIGVISQPKMLTLLLARSISTALTAIISRRYGEGRREEMNRILKQTLSFMAILYAVILGLCLIFFPQILTISGAQDSYFDQALIFGRLVFVGLFFQALTMVLNAAFIGVGKTRIIFLSNLIGNLVNLVLDYGFIYGRLGLPEWGLFGSGLGTISGNLVTFLIMVIASLAPGSPFEFDKKDWWPKRRDLDGLIQVAQGTVPEQVFERIGMFAYTVMVANLGQIYLAVHHICMNICDISYSVATAMGTSNISLTGQMLGRKDVNGAKIYAKVGQRLGWILATVSFILFFFFRTEILQLFSNDPNVIQTGNRIMVIVALVSFPQTFSLINSGVLKGAGDTKYVARYSLVIIAILRPILTYVLLYIFEVGLIGAWISLLFDQTSRAIAASLRYYSDKWTRLEF